MTELYKNKINTIAFYLPQFHAIPENDMAYGKGFTEWTNVRKAQPLFEGHYQPRVPYKYYDLTSTDEMIKQGQLAREHGIFGFCYYHYWFKGGKKLLEKPLENMLNDKRVDIPFCICWANENWSKKWDGGNNELIAEQDYGNKKDWDDHINYLVQFFKDERYICIDGKPLFVIYKPELIPHLKKWIHYLRRKIIDCGFSGIVIAVQYPNYYLYGYDMSVFDYCIDFEPAFTRNEEALCHQTTVKKMIYPVLGKLGILDRFLIFIKRYCKKKERKLEIRDYDTDWKQILNRKNLNEKHILGAFVDWDNTPRNKNGVAYIGMNPEKFKNYLSSLFLKVKTENRLNCVFINAWNEWAEGAYLEPDEYRNNMVLEAVKSAVDNSK